MGVDVKIYFESSDGLEPTELYLPSSGWTMHPVADYEKESGATHTIGTYARYYSMDYERGPWVQICGVLMSLFASINVKRIWYFGDHSDIEGVHPITIDYVLEISRHYMLNAERPYRERVPVVTVRPADRMDEVYADIERVSAENNRD